ncbi:MAG: hypothetical protein ACXVKA_05020 [Acidimicrobiia bacterium]
MNALAALIGGFVAATLVVGFVVGAPKLYWRWRAIPVRRRAVPAEEIGSVDASLPALRPDEREPAMTGANAGFSLP